jgi:hypothetical protein
MTTAPFIPPRLSLVKNENSMPTSPQPFVVELHGLYKIENGKLVGKLEELKRTQEIMPGQVCQVNESHFKVNLLSQPMITIRAGNDLRSAYISQYGVGPTGMPMSNSWVANGMTISNSGFTVAPIEINANVRVGNMAVVPRPVEVIGNGPGYRTIIFN